MSIISQTIGFTLMRVLRRSFLFVLGVSLVGVSCGESTPPREPPRADAAVETPSRVWYRRSRMLDLTGDGQADSVILDAVGMRMDSLRVTLSLVVDGEVKHLEEWGSSYELALGDSLARADTALLRTQLDSVLASVVVRRLSADGGELMAEDSVTLAKLTPRPSRLITFAYGYETTVRLVWDAPRYRFIRLWSCC